MEFKSFAIGYAFCVFDYLIFSLIDFICEKTKTYRKLRNADITDIDVKGDK